MSSIMDFNGSMNVVIIDLADKTSTAITQYAPPGKVLAVHWKSDETLVYVVDVNSAGLEQHEEWAINRHGKENRNLWHWLPNDTEAEFPGIADWLPEAPNTVLAAVAQGDLKHDYDPHFFYVKKLAVGPGGTNGDAIIAGGRDCQYIVDHEGHPRVCLSREQNLDHRLYYRDRATAPWRELNRFKIDDGAVIPLAFTADDKHLYVFSNLHRDTRALFEFDPESNGFTGPLVEVPGADLSRGVFGNDGRSLIGVRYTTEREHVYYLDDAMASLQQSMDSAFPTEHASIHSISDDRSRAIIEVDSDRNPGRFFLYESSTKRVEQVAARAPWIDPTQFGAQRAVRFPAKDGTWVHGYLTLPPDQEAKGLPAVLWPSGGSEGRANPGWNSIAQFFATRGYAVLRVNRRGSGGYGQAFGVPGKGLALDDMRTDLLDGIDWAAGQGIIARDRVALFGADFKRYLSLMSMADSPDAFRCGISYGGEIDLERLFDRQAITRDLWRTRADSELNFWERLLDGHRDAAFLKAQSPLFNADKIQGPVFLAYSINDTQVPYSDAQKLKEALLREHKTAVLLGKDQEPHLFHKDGNIVDLFTQVEQFLQGCNPPH